MWKYYQINPAGRNVGDCSVRAIAKALNTDWETAFALIVSAAYQMADMPSGDSVWGAVLRQHGFYKETVPNTCPDCYTVADFAKDHPQGVYVLGLGGHVVCVVNGDWYDTWDSGSQTVIYFWYKKES